MHSHAERCVEVHHSGKVCIRPVDLHRSIRAHSGRLSKPLVLMMEGPRYRKLFEDCDVDRNGCIDLHDIDKAGLV